MAKTNLSESRNVSVIIFCSLFVVVLVFIFNTQFFCKKCVKSFIHLVRFILFKNCDNILETHLTYGQVICCTLRAHELIGSAVNPSACSVPWTPTCLHLQACGHLIYEEMRLEPINVLNISEVHFLILLVLRSSKNFCTQKESEKLDKQFMAPNNNERFKCVTLWLSPWALETQDPSVYFTCCEMIENLWYLFRLSCADMWSVCFLFLATSYYYSENWILSWGKFPAHSKLLIYQYPNFEGMRGKWELVHKVHSTIPFLRAGGICLVGTVKTS